LAGAGAQLDTTTPNGKMIFGLFAVLAEFERELIIERTRALTPEKLKTLKLLTKTKEFSVTKICQIVGITRSVYYRATNEELS
jgi:DNA invertase Pin-like site-specific DNA recombinase